MLVTQTNTPIIVILINGGPVAIEYIKSNIPGILEAFYPGQSGGAAIADVLFGDYNPGGRMPVTVYKADYIDQISMFDMNMRVSYFFFKSTYYTYHLNNFIFFRNIQDVLIVIYK